MLSFRQPGCLWWRVESPGMLSLECERVPLAEVVEAVSKKISSGSFVQAAIVRATAQIIKNFFINLD